MWLQVINKVKVTHEGQGHIKVKEKYLHPFQFYVAHAVSKREACIQLKLFRVVTEFSEFSESHLGKTQLGSLSFL